MRGRGGRRTGRDCIYVHNIAMIRLGRMRSMNHHRHQHTLSFDILETSHRAGCTTSCLVGKTVCRVQHNYSGQARKLVPGEYIFQKKEVRMY